MDGNQTDISNIPEIHERRETAQNMPVKMNDISTLDINSNKTKDSTNSGSCNKKKWVIISVAIALAIAIIIVVVIVIIKKKKDNDNDQKIKSTNLPKTSPVIIPSDEPIIETRNIIPPPPPTNAPTPSPTNAPTPSPTNAPTPSPIRTTIPEVEPIPVTHPVQSALKTEFNFNTNTDDLKSITVIQRSFDESKFNDQTISTETTRKTNYHIYMLSEKKASPEEEHLFSTLYTGAISIASECYTSGDEKDCTPKEMLDLSKMKTDDSKIRLLEDNIDFKDIPLAICLFNITDNDFITSITCHKDFPDMKKNEMLLDLYFFRAPAIERKNKTRDNITITNHIDYKNKRNYTREQNGGLCNIYNNWGSLCTTDMNITTDLDGNLLSYDELAITNIYYDEKNSFTKNKKSNLKDHSESFTDEDRKNYKNALSKILEKMKPYMEEDVQFSREKFDELYDLIKKEPKEEKTIEEKTTRRRLKSGDAIQYIKKKELFHIDSLGVQVNLDFKINPGLNTNAMSSQLNFSFDDEEHNLYKKDELSDIQDIINKLRALRNAGNVLATQLYDKIADKLENLPNHMSIKLRSFYDLLQYFDLHQIFNKTLVTISHNKLPYIIIQISNDLLSKISGMYLNLEKTGDVKDNVEKLTDTVYKYVNKSHSMVDDIYNNLKELGNILLTKNNPFVQITNYYLNNTSISYIKLVRRSMKVFHNYFIQEFNLSYPKVEKLIKMFIKESNYFLESDREYILDMYTRLVNGSYTIVDISNSDFQKVLSNLMNTYNYTSDIIEKIRNFIVKKLDIKDSGYYLTYSEIAEKNKTYSSIWDDYPLVLQQLLKDDLIDKTFDKIMINFKEEYIKIVKYMAEKKAELFTLEDDVLDENSFTYEDKNNIESKIYEFTKNILGQIKTGLEYKKIASEIIDEFANTYSDNLTEIITDLETIVSEEALEGIVIMFETCLNQSLIKLSQDIDNNVKLTEEYFDHFYNTIYDENYLINVLKNYHIEEIPKIKYFSGSGLSLQSFTDEIYRKERTTIYITKYNEFASNWNYTDKFLKNQLSLEVLEDYKKIYSKIKEILQTITNLEPIQNLIELEELDFYNSHSKSIENLHNRIDTYFSEEIFETKYSKYVEEIITKYKKVVTEEKDYIKGKHNYILKLENNNDAVYDFCIMYQRKICYGCTNCVWNTFDYGRFCIVLTPYENNYLDLIKTSYQVISYYNTTMTSITKLYEKIQEKVDQYMSIIGILENNLERAKNETSNYKYDSMNYIKSYSEYIKSILDNYFGNMIIKSSYNYYYQNIKNKITDLLEDIKERWKYAYKNLHKELNSKYEEIKYTMYEFGIMGQIYQTIIKTDLITNYFDSIILFQKSEFNYTITHYYDYIFKLVNNSYNYIFANFPTEETEYNYILMEKKNETEMYFDLIFKNLTYSESIAINLENQISILNIKEDDFFQINTKIKKTINELDDYIDEKINDIIDIELFHNSLDITQHSLTTRYYLENKEFGKLLEEIYEPLEEGTFFYLDLDNFKGLMIQHWIFDGNYFTNILNDAIYEANKEIKSELGVKFEEYKDTIENEINKFFRKDIVNIVRELFETNIKSLSLDQISNINNAIQENLKDIKDLVKNDLKRIDSDDKHYYNISQVNRTFIFYKEYIYEKINNSLSVAINEFYKNIKKNVYTDCIEKGLDKYLEDALTETSKEEFKEFETLNSTVKIGEIIYNLTLKTINRFKLRTRKKIYYKYVEYFEKIQTKVNLPIIKILIDYELDEIYDNQIKKTLNAHNRKVKNENPVYYDLQDSIKKEINTTIDTSIEKIGNIILTTKGNNFEANFKCPLNFTDIGTKVIRPILESFKDILSAEYEEQITNINKFIQNFITSNLDDFLNNVIPTFGNEFFDRIIDYNINFKVIDLYSNLHYALGQLFLYYAALARYRDNVESLPKDLKYRLYQLNHLNYTIKHKKDDIMILLEQKLTELVENLKDVANDTYTTFLRDNNIIQSSFSPKLLKAIDNNLVEIMPQIKQDYEEALEKYLKEKFLDAFNESLTSETDVMLEAFNEERKRLIEELDSLFTLEIDEDLHEVNVIIFKTCESIFRYYEFMPTFKIDNNLIEFFRLYANVSIVPLFETFRTDLENKTFSLIHEDINNKSQIIEKLNITEFLDKMRELMKYFEIDFYDPILDAIKQYNTPSYEANLFKKRDEYLGSIELRRLVEGGSEDEKNLELKRQESKDVEETFDQLLQLATKAKNNFCACLECAFLYGKESLYYYTIGIVYKNIKFWIKINRYSKNIHKFLMDKLGSLYDILTGYYDNVDIAILEKKAHMKKYINEIYYQLNYTRNITAITLNKEYASILDKTENFSHTYFDNNGRDEEIEYKHKTEHMTNKATANFYGIKEYSEFQFETSLTGGFFKTPRVKARIVGKSRPDKLDMDVKSENGFCGKTIFKYKVKFSDANYTMSLNYNTKSNNIEIITFTDFDTYNYTTQMVQIPDKYELENITYFGYTIYFKKQCYNINNRNLSDVFTTVVEAKHYNETMIIVG